MNLVIFSETNLYEILEISSDASHLVIKTAYRKLARKYHPDLNLGDENCTRKFKQITEAYEILSDPDKKKNYDILKGFYYQNDTEIKRKQANKAYKDVEHNTKKEQKTDYTAKSPENQAFSKVFSEILEGFKQTATRENKAKQPRPEKGDDVNTDVTITLLESVQGANRTINILHTEKCPKCAGRKFINETKCKVCNGLGEQTIHKKLSVKIPQGVKQGSKIRIPNEGNKGLNGGKNGDLYLNIKIENNSIFKYDGLNVHCTVPITPFEAALGESITVPAIEGSVAMKILPGTHSGQKFRLSGQGLVDKNGKKGDMIITIAIEIPKNMSEKELNLYKELKNATKEDIRRNINNGT